MEEYLSKLDLERDYDTMLQLMIQMDNVKCVSYFFTGLNTKVLLSSFLIKNFHDYFLLDENNEFLKMAKTISQSILQKDLEKVGQSYKKFHELFIEWREEDINGMKNEISSAKENLENMVLTETRDDADEQWNEGLAINMKLMDNTVEMLNKYGASPPI